MASQIFDTGKRSDRAVVPPGTVITVQGRPVNSLILLHSGMAELLDCLGDPGGLKPEEVVERSVRVGMMKGEAVCGASGFLDQATDRWSIRTVSECTVSVLPITSEGVLNGIQKKRGLALQVLRALQQCVDNAIYLHGNYKSLLRYLASVADAVALAADWAALSPKRGVRSGGIPDRNRDTLGEYSQGMRTAITSKGIALPEAWDPNLFLDRIQEPLGCGADIDAITVEDRYDQAQYLFVKRLVRRSDEVILPVFEKDEPSQYYVFQFLTRTLESVQTENRSLVGGIRELAERLYGTGGWVEQLLNLPNLRANPRQVTFVHYLWRFTTRCQADMQKLVDVAMAKTYATMAALATFSEPAVPVASAEVAVQSSGVASDAVGTELGKEAGGDVQAPGAAEVMGTGPVPDQTQVAAARQKYQGLARRLVEYSELGSDFAGKFETALTELKALPEKMAGDKAAAHARETFIGLYWELYEACFFKAVTTDLRNPVPGVMLHLGLVDEGLVRPDELALIDQAYNRALSVESPVPVMTLPYFLEKIYTGTVNPSMSEMGESFPELLRRQEKMTLKEKMAGMIFNDSPEGRVRYEIHVIVNPLCRLLSGARSRSLPALCSENLVGNALRIFLDPMALSDFIEGIRKRDFTLFFREVVFKHRLGNELVKKEVMPNFVLYPCAGSRGMMWQELDGTRKDSAARLFIPAFFTDKRDDTVVEMLAFLRWELARAAAGYNWMDPTEGGLSGAYYDYITYYKKNPDLSPTTKDAIKEFISRTRSERDRFAEDYRNWVLYEYESKVRMNSVVRAIFYRFCPFPKEVREQMAKKPMFTDLEVKFQNRARKELLSLETRIRRFEKSGEGVPPEISAWQTMLNG